MSIYRLNGDNLSAAYNKSGVEIQTAYDKNGNVVYRKGEQQYISLKIMSYNVQHFTKLNSQQAMQAEIISKYTPDIIGFQELSKDGSVPAVGQNVLTAYQNKLLSHHINYLGYASKIPIFNLESKDYSEQDPQDWTLWQEKRAYMKGKIQVRDKTITLINTHLCFKTRSIKHLQMKELFDIAQTCEYVILTGDFNAFCLSEDDTDYINMYKQFVDAGYHMINDTATTGFIKTQTEGAQATSLDDLTWALDNVIVSGNISISDFVYDTTKLSYLDGNPIDHIPVQCTVHIPVN